MRFKDFLLNEELGLGSMSGTMDRIFNAPGFQNYSGTYLNGQMNNKEHDFLYGNGLDITPTGIDVPQVERTGRIKLLLKNRNPIFVQLSDGTQASFTYDEWRRIKGEPAVGKMMRIVFQRHPENKTASYSKIDHVIVTD